ncbi:MAG TPA: MFS transporter [Casimicrobiaceae bacterium]|nr:MFS transporter [Casimicrobiaceae bacterium]
MDEARSMGRAARIEASGEPESAYAWTRLVVTLLLSTLGGIGMWSTVVALPAVQADFGVARADASLPYTLTMLGFGFGGIALGRLSDRHGILVPVVIGSMALGGGYVAQSFAHSIWQYAAAQAVIGVGSSATFGPLLAHTSLWFTRRRGIAVAIFASGNYLAGTLWPPIVAHFIASSGWRTTSLGIGVFCALAMLPLATSLRRPAPLTSVDALPFTVARNVAPHALGLSPRALQVLLVIAGFSCCVAMSMPQVHLVAYCADLGYGPARGAQMLSVMLGFGIVSRLTFGFICDRIGGLRTLLLGSTLQGVALLLFLPFDGLVSLYVVSALFGLFQGGIVPSYAIIVREYFSAKEAGARVGTVITATLFGMAVGGWMSGAVFDLTGSYKAAFVNGLAWNLLNVSIALFLLRRDTIEPRLQPR